MGKIGNYENLDDFIRSAKDHDIKEIFFAVGQNTKKVLIHTADGKGMEETQQTTAKLALTAINHEQKVYITHSKDVGEITITPATSQADVDKYEKDCSTGLDEAIRKIQNDYPSADLKGGSCAPYSD